MSKLILDGTLQSLLAYLKQLEGHYDPEQACTERLALEHGRPFDSQRLTAAEHAIVAQHAAQLGTPLDGFEPKQCFWNAQQLVTAGPDGPLAYAEGYVFQKGGLPTHHGWLTINGKVIDVTLRDRANGEPVLGTFSERVYFGIAFETRCVRIEMLRTMSASTLLEDAIDLAFDGAGVVCRLMHDTQLG